MPEAFNRCVKAGGRVRTKTLDGGKYMHICFLKGKSYAGEVKTKEENKYSSALKGKQMDTQEKIHNRILEKKWKSLEARGIKRPKDSEENTKRAKEAH